MRVSIEDDWFMAGDFKNGCCRLHSVQLAAGGGDLLDAELAEISLKVRQSLDQLVLALVPELAALDLGSRLFGVWPQS